jgi:hypothetical protein
MAPIRTRNKRIFFYLFVGCAAAQGMQQTTTTQKPTTPPTDVEATSYLPHTGAWASVFGVYAMGSALCYTATAATMRYALGWVPFLPPEAVNSSAFVTGLAVTVPTTATLFVHYRVPTWYFFYILYKGERVSPMLAKQAMQELSKYAQYLDTIKKIYRELEQLIKTVEQSMSKPPMASGHSGGVGNSSGNTSGYGGSTSQTGTGGLNNQKATPIIDPAVWLEMAAAIANGEEQLAQAQTQITPLLPPPPLPSKIKQPKIAHIDARWNYYTNKMHQCLRALEQTVSETEVAELGSLAKQIVGYWHAYVTNIAHTADVQVQRCLQVYTIEQFIETVLRRDLATPVP